MAALPFRKTRTDDILLSWGDAVTGPERRRTPRLPAELGMHVILRGESAPVRDLSLGGIFILDPDPLPVGTEIEFELHLGEETLALKGVVRRIVLPVGMGVQFRDLTADHRTRLEHHLARLLQAGATERPASAPAIPPSWLARERRRGRRVDAIIPLRLHWLTESGETASAPGVTLAVSATGALIRLPAPTDLPHDLKIEIRATGKTARASVVRQMREEDGGMKLAVALQRSDEAFWTPEESVGVDDGVS